jgi:hypothetical protein
VGKGQAASQETDFWLDRGAFRGGTTHAQAFLSTFPVALGLGSFLRPGI